MADIDQGDRKRTHVYTTTPKVRMIINSNVVPEKTGNGMVVFHSFYTLYAFAKKG
jgi:hypothetical protein